MAKSRTKWEIGVAISKGNEAAQLIADRGSGVVERLKADDAPQLEANVAELGNRRSGQTEALVDQKSKTKGQDTAMDSLNETVMNIRRVVKSANSTPAIRKAFGVGERVNKSISSQNAAANLVKTGYEQYPEWSLEAGILPTDIEALEELQLQMGSADSTQETSKFVRKSKTMDKDSLQVAVEKMVTKISSLGILHYQNTDPALAAIFESLIPGMGKKEK